jgi:hypothetical protein
MDKVFASISGTRLMNRYVMASGRWVFGNCSYQVSFYANNVVYIDNTRTPRRFLAATELTRGCFQAPILVVCLSDKTATYNENCLTF